MIVPLTAVNELADDVSVTFRSGGAPAMKDAPPMVKLTDADEADVVVSQRASSYEGLGLWRRWGSSPRLRTVHENDDDVFSITQENFGAYQAYKEGGDIREATLRYMRTANLVTTTSPHLGDRFRELLHNLVPVEVLPNYVPAWVLELPRDTSDRVPRLGWMGGSSHARDIHTATPAVRRFMKRFPDWELYVNGVDYRPSFKCPPERSFHLPWVHVTDEPQVYYRTIDFDIGICPLLSTQFSRSKCFDADTRVLTQRGVLRGEAVAEGDKVWDKGAWRRVEAVELSAPRHGLRVVTQDGYELRLTPEHRLWVNGAWKETRDIGVGDRLELQPERFPVVPYAEIPWPADGRLSRFGHDPKAFLRAEDGPVLRVTPRWGRLLGTFAGDGSCGQATEVTFHCDGQDQDWIDTLIADWRAVGLNPTTEAVTMRDGTILRKRSVRVASQQLLRVFHSLGVAEEREWKKLRYKRVPCVPEVIWQSPQDVIAEFLAAYFEADGNVRGAGVSVLSKTEQLIRDVQRLLLLFGITSRISPHVYTAQTGVSGVYWRCDLRKLEALLFQEKIGFRSERKRKALEAELKPTPKNREHLLKPLAWEQQVATVEPCDVLPVDLQCEGSVFSLAGFVSHNSWVKALEYFSRGIPVVASDVEPYRRFIDHGVNGFLAKTDHEWLKYLSELACDPVLRMTMGNAAREKARENTIEAHWREWVNAYRMLFPVGWEYKG